MFWGSSLQNTEWVQSQSNEPSMTKDSRIAILFFLGLFHFLIQRIFWLKYLQYVTKNTYNFSVHHIFCINFWWILIKNFLKVYIFYQILRLILKNYPNFRLYKSMLIILWFVFLYHKIQLCFRCHVHYTLFICRKGLLKYFNCVLMFLIFFLIHKFQIVSLFWVWVIN
jgi:hypothetical protein